MAATVSVMMSFLNAGDHAIVSDVVYGGTHRFATKVLARFGVDFDFVDTSDLAAVESSVRPSTRLIFTETPANPTLKLTDLRAVSEIAKAAGVIHAVDNTFLTPYYQRPLELGADLAVHSTTKYLDGHNATLGGAVVAADPGPSRAAQVHAEVGRFDHVADGRLVDLAGRQDPVRADGPPVRQRPPGGPVSGSPSRASRSSDIRASRAFPSTILPRDRRAGFGAMVWFEVAGRPQRRNETDALGQAVDPGRKPRGGRVA